MPRVLPPPWLALSRQASGRPWRRGPCLEALRSNGTATHSTAACSIATGSTNTCSQSAPPEPLALVSLHRRPCAGVLRTCAFASVPLRCFYPAVRSRRSRQWPFRFPRQTGGQRGWWAGTRRAGGSARPSPIPRWFINFTPSSDQLRPCVRVCKRLSFKPTILSADSL